MIATLRSHLLALTPRFWLGYLALSLVLAAAISVLMAPSGAEAVVPNLRGFDLQCLTKFNPVGLNDLHALQGTLSARAVTCTYEMSLYAIEHVVPAIARIMLPIGLATVLLGFVLFGLRLTMQGGVRNPLGDGFVLVFRGATVIFLLLSLTDASAQLNLSRLALGVQTELLTWTSDAFHGTIDPENSSLIKECKAMQENSPDEFARKYRVSAATMDKGKVKIHGHTLDVSLWKTVDCMIGLVVGVGMGVMQGATLFSLVSAMLASGALGVACFVASLIFFLTLLSMVVRSVYVVLQAYVVIGVIMMFLPLVIPTIMFRRTFDYFVRFISLYIGVIFQPVVMIIFLAFAAHGIGLFVVGSENEFKTQMGITQKRSSLKSNPNEIYSLWQVLMFDKVRDLDARMMIVKSLVNTSPGKELISMKGMAALNLWAKYSGKLSNIREMMNNPLGLSKTMDADGNVTERRNDVENDPSALEWAKNLGKELNSINYKELAGLLGVYYGKDSNNSGAINDGNMTGSLRIQPLTMPFLDVSVNSDFDKLLRGLYESNNTRYRALGDKRPVQEIDENGDLVYDEEGAAVYQQEVDAAGNPAVDANGNPVYVMKYWSTHPWYTNNKIDNDFSNWFMRKLFTAIFCIAIMVYIFFSLNRDVAMIARGITGSSANLLMSGGGHGPLGGLPGGDALERMIRSGGSTWTQRFQSLADKESGPLGRLKAFTQGGNKAAAEQMLNFRDKNIGGFMKDIEKQVTGKDKP